MHYTKAHEDFHLCLGGSVEFYKLPFSNLPQKFTCQVGKRSLSLSSKYNNYAGVWMVDVEDAKTKECLIASLPVTTGDDLFYQFNFLGLGALMVALTNGDYKAPPTNDNLGTEAFIFAGIENE